MLYYELKKIWQRPLVLITLCCVCIFHVGSIVTNQIVSYERRTSTIYETFEGQMDEEWKQSIRKKYETFMQDPSHFYSEEELKQAGYTATEIEKKDLYSEQSLKEEFLKDDAYGVLSEAYRASFAQEQIQELVAMKKEQFSLQYPKMDLQQVDDVFSDLLLNSDQLFFNNHMGFTSLLGSMTYHIRSLCVLLIVLLSTVFTNEQAAAVSELQMVCKQQHKLKMKKLIAAILSAGIAWGVLMIVEILSVACSTGFHGAYGMIQDFALHFGPYPWYVIGYVVAICCVSFLASLVLGACLCAISSFVQKNSTAMMLGFVIFLVPPLFNHSLEGTLATMLYYHPANLLSANYVFSDYEVNNIAGMYINRMYIVWFVLIALLMLSCLIVRSRNERRFLMDLRNGDE